MAKASLILVLALSSLAFGAETWVELTLGARGLPDTDTCCSPPVYPPDAYAKVSYAASDSENFVAQGETINISNQPDPDWPEVFTFTVQDGSTARVKVEIWDSNVINDHFIGFADFHISEVQSSFGHVLERELNPQDSGRLRVTGHFNGSRGAQNDDLFDHPRRVIHIPVPVAVPTITKLARH